VGRHVADEKNRFQNVQSTSFSKTGTIKVSQAGFLNSRNDRQMLYNSEQPPLKKIEEVENSRPLSEEVE
jgi:hypothetical protein